MPAISAPECALARAGRADDGDDLTSVDPEIDAGDTDLGGISLAPDPGQVMGFDEGRARLRGVRSERR